MRAIKPRYNLKKPVYLSAAFLLTSVMVGVPCLSVYASVQNPVVGGKVYSTGQNYEGQIGSGDEMLLKSPVKVALPAGLTAVSVAQSVADTWVLASDGNVYGAGYNKSGELGDGTTVVRSTPVKLQLPGGLTVTSLKAHDDGYPSEVAVHVIASDGNVYSVGHNQYGEFGNGQAVTPLVPNVTATKFNLPGGVTAVEIESTGYSTYVRGSDGNVYGAGYNHYGQLGDSTTNDTSTPVKMLLPGGVSAQDIILPTVPSVFNVYVKGSDGQLYGTGQDYGKFGDGTSNSQETTPVRFNLPGGLSVVSVVPDDKITTVIASDGNVYSAGANFDGQLGNGLSSASSTPVQFNLPVGVTATKNYTTVFSTSHHVVGSDGQLYSSGYNDYGRFGIGSGMADDSVLDPTAFTLPGGVSVVDVSITWGSLMVVGSDGHVYSAGYNDRGQFGDGSITERDNPVVMSLPGGVNAAKVYVNENDPDTAYVLTTTGATYATGLNDLGQAGVGTVGGNILAPQAIVLPGGVTTTAASLAFWMPPTALFIGSNNQLYSVGYNKYGQGATGTATGFVVDPAQFVLPGGVNAIEIAQSDGNLFVLGSDGNVYGAGDNFYGQLGDGTKTDRFAPVRFQLPAGVTGIKIFFPSGNATSVLASDGNVYSAGFNTYGNLGVGVATTYVTTPSKFVLPAGVTVARISDSYGGTSGGGLARNMSVIGSDGVAYTAGANGYAQVGNGTSSFFPNVVTPQAFILPGGLTAVKVHNMDSITAVEASDGQVYLAGVNGYGQLGNGTNTDTSSVAGQLPTKFILPGSVKVARFDGTPSSSHVIGDNNQLYGAGENSHGELGDTTLINSSTPVRFQLPGVLTVRSTNDFKIEDTGFGRVISVVASDNLVYSSGFGPNGSGAPNTFQSTPIQLPMPGGLTVSRMVSSYNPNRQMSVIASNGQYYVAGSNAYGQLGDGTTTDATSLVRFQLPAGVTAVEAVPESNANVVLGSNGKLYVAGQNSSGWLGGGVNTTVANVTEYTLPVGTSVLKIAAILGNKISALTTPFVYGIGSQTYCDTNSNGAQDAGETMVNGQTVNLYASVAGHASGPIIASYTTQSYQTYEGIFFFDDIPSGDYIVGLVGDSGIAYSQTFTVSGGGDGWILGNSAYISTVSAMGQTGVVCGASTVVPPTTTTTPPTLPPATSIPSTPGDTLAPTGVKIGLALLIAAGIFMTAFVVVSSRTKGSDLLAELHQGLDDVVDDAVDSLNGRTISEVVTELGIYLSPHAVAWAELSRSGQVHVMLDGTIVSREER